MATTVTEETVSVRLTGEVSARAFLRRFGAVLRQGRNSVKVHGGSVGVECIVTIRYSYRAGSVTPFSNIKAP